MKYLIIAVMLALPVIALGACGDDDGDDDGTTVTQTTSAATMTTGPTVTHTAVVTTPPTTEPTTVPSPCPDNPDPATAEQVVIDEPQPGDSSQSPLTVSGQIAVFEAQFNISILGPDGTPIVDNMSARSSEGQTLAPFQVDVPFTVTEQTAACLQLYDISNEDGMTHIDIAQVPVTLLP